MIPIPGPTQKWTQKNDRDVVGSLFQDLNVMYASKALDITENIGRLRVGKRIILNTGQVDLAAITNFPVAFRSYIGKIFTLAGLNGVGKVFSNDGTLTDAFSVDSSLPRSIVFSGSGINDLSSTTADTSGVNHVYVITISATGTPDHFTYTIDGGSPSAPVAITAGNIAIANGVTVNFAATTGHTLADNWTISVTAPPSTIDSTLSDMEIFNGALYLTCKDPASPTFSAVFKNKAGVWTQPFSFTSNSIIYGYPNPLCNFRPLGRMYMACNESNIISWDTTDTPTYSGTNFTFVGDSASNGDYTSIITFIKASSTSLWIGTVNTSGGQARIFQWDGASSGPNAVYNIKAAGALSCVIKDDVPWVMDSNGNLLVYNGGTFTSPRSDRDVKLFRRKNELLYNPLSAVNNRFIHPNGMTIVNGKINLLIDGRCYDSTLSVEDTIPSGVWEYDDNTGSLYHKGAVSQNHATDTLTDFGAHRLAGVGAIQEMNLPSTSATRNGMLMLGASYYIDATNIKSGIFYDDSNDTLKKAGYLITGKFEAADAQGNPSVQNMWQNLYILYRNLLNAGDIISMKYRITETSAVMATITWVDSTHFTVPNSSINVGLYWSAGTGAEVEILNGVGSGICSHIINAVLASGTWTVTVDETYTGATGTAMARFQLWTKYINQIMYNASSPSGVTFDQEGINLNSNWIQFKIWMLFTGKDELEKLLLINENYNPAN